MRLTDYGDEIVLLTVARRSASEREPYLCAERLTLSMGLLGYVSCGLLAASFPAAGASRQAAGRCDNCLAHSLNCIQAGRRRPTCRLWGIGLRSPTSRLLP